jgi:hypothetical protein
MKRQKQSVLLASLLAMALAGCSSTGMNDRSRTSSNMGVSQGDAGAVNSSSDSGTPASTGDTSYGSSGSGAGAVSGSETGQSASTQPVADPSAATQSSASEAGSGQPSMDQTSTGQSVADQPTMGQTGSTQVDIASATSRAPNSTITNIEIAQGQDGSRSTSMGSSGAGATGSGAGATSRAAGRRLYQITLRMDDGTSQVLTQAGAPVFRTGDRIRAVDGVILR